MKMCTVFSNRSKFVSEIMKFSFHHRAFYCYIGMSLWIFFLITVMYKYMSVGEEAITPKKIIQTEYISKSDTKFRKLYQRACNPPESIVRGTEGVVDTDSWLLQGILVLTRHGDRGPLTHLKGGDKLPCDLEPNSPLLKSYVEYVVNASVSGRAYWVAGPGPFHNFPSLPPHASGTHCALGQLTPKGLLQMISVGVILREAYADKLNLNFESAGKKDNGEILIYSTRYRRTFQSLVGVSWGLAGAGAGAMAGNARESHSVAFCAVHCACNKHHALSNDCEAGTSSVITEIVQGKRKRKPKRTWPVVPKESPTLLPDKRSPAKPPTNTRKINSQAKNRLESHPAIKELVIKLSKVLFETQDHVDPDVVRDALLAYMCHDAPLPCNEKPKSKKFGKGHRNFRQETLKTRRLKEVDIDTLNMELDYINNQVDFNNEIGKKAKDIIGKYYDTKDKKAPLDFDAQMEREKLLYYQQRYFDNADAYDDVVIVKKNLDADFNFPNDARMDTDFDEDYREPTEAPEDFCIKKEHIMSLFAYLEWSYRQEIKNIHNRRRGLLVAYGLLHNIVQNMIRMISENKPKFVLYSGHDKTLQALILALGLTNYQHYNIQYASRMIFEVYRKKDLRDELKFTKRKAVAQDFYFRVVYNGEDITNKLSFCKNKQNLAMKVVDPIDNVKVHNTYLCPIENIVRFIHDDYFATFNATNYRDACATYGTSKRI